MSPAGEKIWRQFRPKRQFWGVLVSKVYFTFLAQKNRLEQASKPLLDPEFEVVKAFGPPLENRHLHVQTLMRVPNTPRALPLVVTMAEDGRRDLSALPCDGPALG